MHCVSCDCFLTETELMMVKEDDSPEDMCYECRAIAFNAENLDVREYQHSHLTEMIDNYFFRKNLEKDIDSS